MTICDILFISFFVGLFAFCLILIIVASIKYIIDCFR